MEWYLLDCDRRFLERVVSTCLTFHCKNVYYEEAKQSWKQGNFNWTSVLQHFIRQLLLVTHDQLFWLFCCSVHQAVGVIGKEEAGREGQPSAVSGWRGGWKGKRKTVEERQFNNNKWLNAKWCLNTQRVLAGCYLFLLFSIETWMDFFSTSVCASMCVCLCVGIKYYFSIFKIVVLPLKVFFK